MPRADFRMPALLLACLLPALAQAVEIQLVVVDSAGTGFLDSRPANPAAGNNGAPTLGQQRLRVVQRAAEIWGAQLSGSTPIRVAIRMVSNQACGSEGTTLATAGPTALVGNFPNAPRPNTAYPVALGNSLSGQFLTGFGQNHIQANFNLRIDDGCSPNLVGWWYGVDPNQVVPTDRMAMLSVALHELGHGLGFTSGVDASTGQYYGSMPSVWSNYLYDVQAGKHWRSMTAQERVNSARNDPHLVWTGIHVGRNIPMFLRGTPMLRTVALRGGGDEVTDLGLAMFGPGWPGSPLRGEVVLVNDGVGGPGAIHDGCEAPFVNGDRLAGRIALIDRGTCNFTVKISHAQSHGAIAVVIVNNQPGVLPTMAGADSSITIPAVAISDIVGVRLKRHLRGRPYVLELGQTGELSGQLQGCARMYAPAQLEGGSSVSHFTRDAFPDLLMEPSISSWLFDEVDLTLDLFRDLGWRSPIPDPSPPLPNGCVTMPLP